MRQDAAMNFAAVLAVFAGAVQANNGAKLTQLFTPDGTDEDGFFGARTGRESIAAMQQRFHETGSDYLWEFSDPASDGTIGYARFGSAMPRGCRKAQDGPCCSRGSASFLSRRSDCPLP
jgi:SnoaL-like protein